MTARRFCMKRFFSTPKPSSQEGNTKAPSSYCLNPATARSEPNSLTSCRPSSTALVPLKPIRRRIASNSASVSACAPRRSKRSRGRSPSGHATMPFDFRVFFSLMGCSSSPHNVAPHRPRGSERSWCRRMLGDSSSRSYSIVSALKSCS